VSGSIGTEGKRDTSTNFPARTAEVNIQLMYVVQPFEAEARLNNI
jgi:hypothetical protein